MYDTRPESEVKFKNLVSLGLVAELMSIDKMGDDRKSLEDVRLLMTNHAARVAHLNLDKYNSIEKKELVEKNSVQLAVMMVNEHRHSDICQLSKDFF